MAGKLLQIRLNANLYQDFNDFDSFKDIVLSQALKIDSELKKKYEKASKIENADPEDVYPGIEEEYDLYEGYEKEMYKALVVLLYSRIEIKLKDILNIYDHSYTIYNKKIERFDFKKIEKAFKNLFSIIIKKIELFNSFDELRELNNCLKHKEIVSNELKKKNRGRWRQGEEIKLTKDDLDRLLPNSKKFFLNLIDELKKKLAENQ
ncbi:MAG: hypothetical protein IK015_09020 [Treponema sp.]|nr:hypothetical protein [Treponema sp.]